MVSAHKRTLSPDIPWSLRALIGLFATLLFASLFVDFSFPDEAAAAPDDLLLVTDDGLATGRNADLKALFEGFGWTVTSIDDDTAPAALTSAAESSGVVYVAAGSNSDVADELAVTRAPVVSEDLSGWGNLLTPGGNPSSSVGTNGAYTELDVLSDVHPITNPMGTGLTTVFTSGQTWSSWSGGVGAGMQTLAARPDSSTEVLLMTAESGASMLVGEAEHRRVFFGLELAPVSSWNTTLEAMVERSLDWAAAGTARGGPPPSPIGDLVMVTGSGGFGLNTDSVKRNLFESFGWTVTALSESASAVEVATAAAANDVMFASDSLGGAEAYDLRDEAIGIVNEHFSGWSGYLNAGAQYQSTTTTATVEVVDVVHPITSFLTAGSLTVHTASGEINYWDSGIQALPVAVDVLIEGSASSDFDALVAADTGAALYSSYTAADRRVWFPSDSSDPALWTPTYETLLERSLLWAASFPVDALVDSDGDGLWDSEEDANTDADDDPSTNPGPNTDGDGFPNYLDADDDGDGTPTNGENPDPNSDGDPRDTRDSDRDGQPDYLDDAAGSTSGGPVDVRKVSETSGGLVTTLEDVDRFGNAVASIGDLDGDGVIDIAVGAPDDDDGASSAGAVYVLFLNADGSVKSEQKISSTVGGGPTLTADDYFGTAISPLGDLDGDGVTDLIVGSDGSESAFVLFMNTDGTVRSTFQIAAGTNGLAAQPNGARFGYSVAGIGDLDGDGIPDAVVGDDRSDQGGFDFGAIYVLFLNADGTVKAEQEISDVAGGLVHDFGGNDEELGGSIAALGDIDGDGVGDLAVGAVRVRSASGDQIGGVHILRLNADGTVKGEELIENGSSGFPYVLGDSEWFGSSATGLGDIDGDGVPDVVVGAELAYGNGNGAGAVFVLTLNSDGSVKAARRINSSNAAFSGELDSGDAFGSGVANLGDLDGDGLTDLAVGASSDDDGGSNRGAVYVFELCEDSDGDGLCDEFEALQGDTDGDTVLNQNDPDDDGDLIPTASENADPNGDGDPRDALDSDRDGQPDYLDAPIMGVTDGTVRAEQKISDTQGGLVAALDDIDDFGWTVSSIGDVDGDGVVDIAVGAVADDDGGTDRGAVYVLLLNSDGSVKGEQKISDTAGGLVATLDDFDNFGQSVSSIGDVDGDGVVDIAVGAVADDDGGTDRGAVYVLLLNSDGSVKGEQKISDTAGGLAAVLDDGDRFGMSVSSIGDVDGDGVVDLVVGTERDDDGGADRGAVYVLLLNSDGSVKGEQKISDTAGGLSVALGDFDRFGVSVSSIGDVDGDGVVDIAVGAHLDDDGGTNRGAVYVLLLNSDGSVKGEQKISDTVGGLAAVLDASDNFGVSVSGLGDVDGDGVVDVAVGAQLDDDGGADRGAVYVLFLNADGSVRAEQKISDTAGGLSVALDGSDRFGFSVSSIGDVDGDGVVDIAVGAYGDDDGGSNRGAVYVLNLAVGACGAVDSDGDGLLDCEEDANTDADNDPATNPGPNTDGDAFPNYLDADDDGDGTPTASENADPTGDGDPRDAIDTDRDGEPDYLDGPTVAAFPWVVDEQKVSDLAGGLAAALDDGDGFGERVASIGDLDGDGIGDLAVSAPSDGGGAIYILFLNGDGTIRSEQKISDTEGGLTAVLNGSFGDSVAGLGDVDGDGFGDLAVGASFDNDGGSNRGAVYVLFLNADGSVRSEQKISDISGGLSAPLDDSDYFGVSVASIGDINGDGTNDLVVGASGDDDTGSFSGAAYVLFLGADGSVRAEQKISGTAGGLTATIAAFDTFGDTVGGLGDLDGDGVGDIAIGAPQDDDGVVNGGAVHVVLLNSDGTVKAEQKLSAIEGGVGPINGDDFFGRSLAGVGDVDADGVVDLVVGAETSGVDGRGRLHVLLLNADGTVRVDARIGHNTGGLTGPLDVGDYFGWSVAGLGDLDGDGAIGLAVGTLSDDDGGPGRGAFYILDLAARADSDGDGLWDDEEDADTDADFDPATNPGPNTDGDGFPNYLDADDDGDTIPTASENADPNGDGDPRDARDTDRDGQSDYLDDLTVATALVVATVQKISDVSGGFTGVLDDFDSLGSETASIGDVDGDGTTDLVFGISGDDDGGSNRGAVVVVFMNPDGTVKAEQKISSTQGGLTGPLDDGDQFGSGVAGAGDIDGDGVADIAIGARYDDDGASQNGAVYLLFLNADGTVKAEQKLSSTQGGLSSPLTTNFGDAVAGIGDLDGDGVRDIAVGSPLTNSGSVHVVFLRADGTARSDQVISSTEGGFTGPFGADDRFGGAISGLGDVDGDGVVDIGVGAFWDGGGGTKRGALYVLFMNPDGTVKAEQKIGSAVGGLAGPLADDDAFGSSVTGVGDLDGDGVNDVAIGAYVDADGGAGRGAVYVLLLNADGTVKAEQKISDLEGGFTPALDNSDYFGRSVAAIGDLDGDGTIGLAVGAAGDDDGGSGRGAVYVLDLERFSLPLEVNSTGDAGDLTPGDGVCDTGAANAVALDECTLRAAIEEANAFGGASISFDIPFADSGQTGSVWTMAPTSGYENITVPITIDGSSQPGFTSTPVIQLDGSAAGNADGFNLQPGASGSTVRHLAIANFAWNAIDTQADDTTIAGNHLGLDAVGLTAEPIGLAAVYIDGTADVIIGGSTALDRNVIGSGSSGIVVDNGAVDTVVTGNYIGIDVTGSASLPAITSDGIRVEAFSPRTIIGGSSTGAGNVIGWVGDDGIDIRSGNTDTLIEGNLIGVGLDGTSALPVEDNGVVLSGSTSVAIVSNVVGNVGSVGISIGGSATTVVIQGNVIGTDGTLTASHPTGRQSIQVGAATSVLIGGLGAGEGNVVLHAPLVDAAISVQETLADDVTIVGNAIESSALVIDLGGDGATPNDPLDADGGANDLMNYPELTITSSTTADSITWDVDLEITIDVPAGDYRLEVFDNESVGYSGAGGAEQLTHALTVTHPGGGPQTFITSYSGPQPIAIAASATENFGGGAYGSTSEISPALVASVGTVVVNSTGNASDSDLMDRVCDTGGVNSNSQPECTLRAAIQQTNRDSAATIEFAIPVSDVGYVLVDDYWVIAVGGSLPALRGQGLTIDGSTQPGFIGIRPVVHVRGGSSDTIDILAPDVTVQHFSIGAPGDDAIQVRGERALIDGMWLGLNPVGDFDGSFAASNEGIIIYDGSEDVLIRESRVADLDSGVVSNSGTIDAVVTGTEVFGNRDAGVLFNNSGTVTLLGNSIHDNGELGFELNDTDDAPLPNDVGDADTGPNDLLNKPIITAATVGAGTVDVDYVMDVPPGTYRIEFFDSDRPDPSGFGEGQRFLSAESIVHPGGSVAYVATVVASEGDVITATATPDLGGGTYGGTSEFSNARSIGVLFVNSTGDAGDLALGDGVCDTGGSNPNGSVECTLRAAIEEANASVDVGFIHFQMADTDPNHTAGTWTLSPATALPALTLPVTIDGTTQPGFVANTNPSPQGLNWTQVIMIDGSLTPSGSDGFWIQAPDVTISGFAIGNFQTSGGHGVQVDADRATITAVSIGTDLTGMVAAPIAYGLWVTGADLMVGGLLPGDRNLITGADNGQITLTPGPNALIEGNLIGVDVDASAVLAPFGTGVEAWAGPNITIGTSDAGNVIGGHWGIETGGNPITIENNIIGTDASFTADLGDLMGIRAYDNATITGNVIANTETGVQLSGSDIVVAGNFIGTDPSGTVDLGMTDEGIAVSGVGTTATIGGIGAGNVIANSGADGIWAPTGQVTMLDNEIYNNGGLGIDLLVDGVTVNNSGDAVLDHPAVIEVTGSGGFVTVRFQLDVPAGDYRIEAFANPSGADPSGHGEGEVFVGGSTVTHAGGGAEVFELDAASPDGVPISLTATEDLGGGTFGATSEYSANATPTTVAIVEDIGIRMTDLTAAGGLEPLVSAGGIAGDGLSVDGGAERLVGPPTDIASNELTMSVWVNLDVVGNDPRILSKGAGAGTTYELAIDSGTSEAVARLRVGGSLVEARGGSVSTGMWHHVVAAWNGFVLTLFVDGVVVDTVGAVGTLTRDLDQPLVLGNNSVGTAGLNGTVDQVELRHTAMPAAEVLARFRNGQTPALVTIGGEQTAAPAPWTTSPMQARTGGSALAAPTTAPGSDAWITAMGIDEPGVELTAWWWISDAGSNEVAAGTRTGANPTDQFDVAASGTGLDLGAIGGAGRASVATDPTMLSDGAWQQVVMSTDELGITSFRLDGVQRVGPVLVTGPTSGSIGFRAVEIDPGQLWFIDDVEMRRLVSDEPTISFGPIERN